MIVFACAIIVHFRPDFYPKIVGGICLLAFFIGVVILPLSKFGREKNMKTQEGEMFLCREGVIINRVELKFHDIISIDLSYSDYRGKVRYRGKLDVNGMYSEGVKNIIKISTCDGQVHGYNYLLTSKNHMRRLYDFMELGFQEGKINKRLYSNYMDQIK
ncbi:hypothetical protein [Lewinella sp. JB7]|uniref:hypothetical protein n=1 Tax=Lewinella sp. JB7 TaxID=2962887 RepID=UPI0020CA2382|nr:hypothetical protein [Lewinella sp. JB7]MCP9237971.1 hypothetical protein [Lewinella sp. JB7]